MKAWYFSNKEKTLRYGDNRPISIGTTHTVGCEPVLCQQGLHASINILDAFKYAPDPIVWRVVVGGTVVKGGDKCVATERTYIGGGIDITHVLRKFARMCALDVIHLWDAPQVVIDYLKTGNEQIRHAARDAAESAWPAAWATGSADARAAARKKQSCRLTRMINAEMKRVELPKLSEVIRVKRVPKEIT